MQDRDQKLKAIRYCVASGLVPFMEVVVVYEGDTGASPTEITDVDVLGIKPADASPLRRVIFDCKTLARLSPIGRALWARGLSSLIAADEAFIILTKPAPDVHRLAGNAIGVRLFSEDIFDAYASAASTSYGLPNSYIERIDCWESLIGVGSKYPALREHVKFIQSAGPLTVDAPIGIRTLVASLRRIEGELDPEKPEHRAVFTLSCMLLLVFLSELVRAFNNVFDPSAAKEGFESTLRNYIWGGKENVELRQKLKDALAAKRGSESTKFELPGWDTFVEMFRSMLDAPAAVGTCCLPMQDIAFRELTTSSVDLDKRLSDRFSANTRVRQFVLLASQYIISASKIPKDFRVKLSQKIIEIAKGA